MTGPLFELVLIDGDRKDVKPLPDQGTVTLGNDNACEICIENATVSRRHARLHLGSQFHIEDLKSTNGTFVWKAQSVKPQLSTAPVRRVSTDQPVELAIGDRVSIGKTVVVTIRRALNGMQDVASSSGIVLHHASMLAIYKKIQKIAESRMSVLILGATGVGKEVLARAIHDQSPRASKPFVAVNVTEYNHDLLEGQLFGHEKGSFTGAGQAHTGLFESANGGTIFLDEVGELPLAVQVKLLRVIQDREIRRLGSNAPRKLDVRWVGATNRDLKAQVASGTFREDLYFRLCGDCITIPPLRERDTEIVPLARQFLAAAALALDRPGPLVLSPDAERCLVQYSWPGNVRELKNVIERAVVLAEGNVIEPADLPSGITDLMYRKEQGVATARTADRASANVETPPERESLVDMSGAGQSQASIPRTVSTPPAANAGVLTEREQADRQRIIEALESCAGNQTRAARMLGIGRRTLLDRMDRYRMRRPRKAVP
jgi:two-component system response regulator AtoC